MLNYWIVLYQFIKASSHHVMANSESDTSSTTSSSSDGVKNVLMRSNSTELEERKKKNNGFLDLFGLQLEVTSRLLDAENKKLNVLQRELLSQKNSCQQSQEIEQLKLNLSRYQQHHDRLEQEYNETATKAFKNSNRYSGSSRSQPAIGLKQTPKLRASIFGTLTKDKPTEDCLSRRRRFLCPQMSTLSPAHNAGDTSSSSGVSSNLNYDDISSEALIYQDGNLVSGSLTALIQHLVPTATYYPDRTYIFAFLLSSRLFIKPHALLAEVVEVCRYQQNLDSDNISKETLGKFGPYLIQILGEWTEMFPYDFRDDRMMTHLKDLTQRIVHLYPELGKDIGIIMRNLVGKLSGLQKYEELLQRINQEVANRLLNILPTTDIYETCPAPLVLAQQLTHIELERLSMIGPEEFVQAFAKDNDKCTSFMDMKKTSNLEAYVSWFNRLSFFIASEICMHLKKKNRLRMIEYFIDVAKECINIGNFNSLMAIIAGINMSPIQRLKKTWLKLNKDKFDVLEHQMNPTLNFSCYRSSLKAALWRAHGAVDDREKIVIPFFSLFVKDMYFLNEGSHNRMPGGNINFEKFWQLAKQLTEFISWKQVECPFDKHPAVLNYLLTNPVFSENSLSLASFECEPPENKYEKDRYASLKLQAGL